MDAFGPSLPGFYAAKTLDNKTNSYYRSIAVEEGIEVITASQIGPPPPPPPACIPGCGPCIDNVITCHLPRIWGCVTYHLACGLEDLNCCGRPRGSPC